VRLEHLIRFHGVLAPNAKLRSPVVPQWPAQPEDATEAAVATGCEAETAHGRPYQISGVRLLKRIFSHDMA
jgi:hypothetical protein